MSLCALEYAWVPHLAHHEALRATELPRFFPEIRNIRFMAFAELAVWPNSLVARHDSRLAADKLPKG